jgi:L-lactate permease
MVLFEQGLDPMRSAGLTVVVPVILLRMGVFIFALAYIFNYSGMAASLAYTFSKLGV